MSDISAPAAGGAAVIQVYDPKSSLKAVGLSIFINGVLPFAVYKILAPHFASGSIMPLLYASAFPLLGFAVGLIRTRAVDAIAAFALFGIFYSIGSTLLAGEVRLALILGSTQAFLIAGLFLVSALIGRPVIFFVSRQFATGNDPAGRERFAAVDKADGGRTFFIATMVWAVGIALLGAVSIVLAITLAPATYLLVNNIINTGVNLLLVVWTIRFVRPRMMRAAQQLEPE